MRSEVPMSTRAKTDTAEAFGPDRYSRQVRFPGIGPEGQERIRASKVVLVGCGALGTHLADHLVRGGVGELVVVDRDYVEPSNLQRQVLFDEEDAAAGLPKAIAAARKLSRINSDVRVNAVAEDLGPWNAARLLGHPDLLLDGTDNFATRYLVNDYSVKEGVPWIYGACVGASGLVFPVLPREGACLRCVFPAPPPAEITPTCETAGVIAPIVAAVAAVQAAEAFKLLSGKKELVSRALTVLDLWESSFRTMNVPREPQADCPTCAGRFEFLEGSGESEAVKLCGRTSVQVSPPPGATLDLPTLAARLRPTCRVDVQPFMLRFEAEGVRFTVFPGGRAILQGTDDPVRARAIYARYVGS
jgi:adenylyltransferase/sulfurtransferase